jgi:hypothetical protein
MKEKLIVSLSLENKYKKLKQNTSKSNPGKCDKKIRSKLRTEGNFFNLIKEFPTNKTYLQQTFLRQFHQMAGLKLRSSCLLLLSAGITDVYRHTQLVILL